jgi:outer membrane protein
MLDYQALLGLTPVRNCTLDPGDISARFNPEEITGYRAALPPFETMVDEALQRRADYRQTELLLQSAEHGISIARSGHFPSINAFATYAWNNIELNFDDFSDFDRFFYGVSLSIPIFSNFSVSTAVERSEITRMDTEEGLRQLRRTITSDIMKALNNLDAAEKNIDIAQKKEQSAREDLRTATERYELGAGTLLDQIVASSNMTAAESDVINAAFNYLTARRQLEYQLGKLDF